VQPSPTGEPTVSARVVHAECTWEQVGWRVWCREHDKPIYVGQLPPARRPDPCNDHPWGAWVGGIYRSCPACFLVEWEPKFAPKPETNGKPETRARKGGQ
jgi:hypothetical protein